MGSNYHQLDLAVGSIVMGQPKACSGLPRGWRTLMCFPFGTITSRGAELRSPKVGRTRQITPRSIRQPHSTLVRLPS